MKIVFGLIVGVLAVDVIGFIAWVLSGQYPDSVVYVGSITSHVLGLIFF
jgi:hypothetical protein